MPKICFFKELANNRFYVAGRPVDFEPLPGNRGWISLESPKDDTLIAALTDASNKQIGGILSVTEEELDKKKETAASNPFPLTGQKEYLRQMPKGPFARKPAPVAPVVANAPSRDAVPFSNSALAKLVESKFPTPAPSDAVSQVAPDVPAESFRPMPRRVGRPRKNPVETVSALP